VIPVIDGHNDALLRVWRSGESLREHGDDGHLDLPRMREGGIAAAFFAIYVPEDDYSSDPRESVVATDDGWEVPFDEPLGFERASSVAHELAAIADRDLTLVRTIADLERCVAGGEPGAILHLEGAEPIEPGLGNLDDWIERGVRSLGIAWSRPNAFGCGVPFQFPGTPDVGPGLTEAGRDLVHTCNERGVMLDLAHLNERGFFDVAELSNAPLVVSHAAAHALAPMTRSLTDSQLDAIGDSGGLVGVVFDVVMTRSDGDLVFDTALDVITGHIEYIAERIGLDHVALGSDFDGCFPPAALDDASKMQALLDALRWNDDELEKLAHGNWLRVLRDTWND
jgi:membrane dipeptidase